MKEVLLTGLLRKVVLLSAFAGGLWSLDGRAQAATSSQAQAPTGAPVDASAPMRFEVASIRAEKSGGDGSSNRQMLPGGRFVATGTTARTLIRIAFGVDDNRIAGIPGWAADETFQVSAVTVNRAEVTTPQQFQQLILSLLEDRFQFKFHREQAEAPVYWLELVKPEKAGPGLKPSTPDEKPNMSSNSNGSKTMMRVTKMSMVDIAAGLRRQSGRPVEDHTGLAGNYDFEIEWAPQETQESEAPSLFTVLKEQLGLKLRPAKGTTETIVVDRIAHPSED
jgi:uncharacterized protein (TIGR03435 family)